MPFRGLTVPRHTVLIIVLLVALSALANDLASDSPNAWGVTRARDTRQRASNERYGEPVQAADAVYNRYWGCLNALQIPSHCTFYAVDSGCCCNIPASQWHGICRWADFDGPEAGWPQCPL
jgi:hypothetical protein